jgi:radical SAM superfamily enzyme YgiQ (UPF0313 family)
MEGRGLASLAGPDMRVLLISANTEHITMPVLPLGLAFVAKATQSAGHDVRLLNLMDQTDIHQTLQESIQEFRPEVIGISVRNIDDQSMLNTRFLLEPIKGIVASCRSLASVPIVVGGAGYSIFPRSALAYLGADMGIRGEGEHAFVTLLEKLDSREDPSSVPGVYLPEHGCKSKARFARDLDRFPLPLPDEHPWIPSTLWGQESWLPFQTRRGCPLDCNYCSTASIEGRGVRKHSPEHVVEVISRYIDAGFDHFHFVDNTFNLPASYAKNLCDRIIAAGLKITWRCILYPWKVDEGLVERMARAGCLDVSLGCETGSEMILKIMNKRFTLKEVRKISKMLKEHGIRQMGFLLLGGPGENRRTVEESLSYIDSLDLEIVKITTGIRIYPHTPLARTAVGEGIISRRDDLLLPKFYMTRGLEDWLRTTIDTWASERPHWMT